MENNKDKKVNIIASAKNWIEGEAVQQLENTAKLPGMVKVVGMPDLHPGKGHPIGAAFISKEYLYPYLVSNDIGCGMGLWQTDLKSQKLKLERWVNKLDGLESSWEGNINNWLEENSVAPTKFDSSLGTIGGGNHFAELQIIHEIKDKSAFSNLGLEKNKLVLLVHSGSRGFGESILREHIERFKANGLRENTLEADNYLEKHNLAVNWAKANRKLIPTVKFSVLRRTILIKILN